MLSIKSVKVKAEKSPMKVLVWSCAGFGSGCFYFTCCGGSKDVFSSVTDKSNSFLARHMEAHVS